MDLQTLALLALGAAWQQLSDRRRRKQRIRRPEAGIPAYRPAPSRRRRSDPGLASGPPAVRSGSTS